MGLDQYAYTAAKASQRDEWYEGAEWNEACRDLVNPNMAKPRDLAQWRKHPNLQGWMESLYRNKGGTGTFNGVELELTWEDLDQLQQDITGGSMAQLNTTGFFFGNPSDEIYREQDLEFIKQAKADLFCGLKVFYNSSW